MVWYAVENNQIRPVRGISGLHPFCVPTLTGFFIGDKMKRISLTQGQFTIVDNKNYEWLNQWKWCAAWSRSNQSFYATRSTNKNGKQRKIYMARESLGLFYSDKRK